MPDFDKLRENAKKLVGLLEKPEPGLISWAMMTCRTWKAIAEQWDAKTAAAPELYEALDDCHEILQRIGHGDLACAISARAALAKARGDA